MVRVCFLHPAYLSSTYLKGMARTENRPQEGNFPDPGRHPAAGHETDNQADLQEEH